MWTANARHPSRGRNDRRRSARKVRHLHLDRAEARRGKKKKRKGNSRAALPAESEQEKRCQGEKAPGCLVTTYTAGLDVISSRFGDSSPYVTMGHPLVDHPS